MIYMGAAPKLAPAEVYVVPPLCVVFLFYKISQTSKIFLYEEMNYLMFLRDPDGATSTAMPYMLQKESG